MTDNKALNEISKNLGYEGKNMTDNTALNYIANNILNPGTENIEEQIQNCLVGKVVTQAEYDALGDVVLTNGVTYIIQG